MEQINFIRADGPEMIQIVDQLTERMFKVVREEEKPDDLLTFKQACEYVQVCDKKMKTILEETGVIKWKYVGREIRVSRKSIDKWMNS